MRNWESRTRRSFKGRGGGNRKMVRSNVLPIENDRPVLNYESDLFDDEMQTDSDGSFDINIMSRETEQKRINALPSTSSSPIINYDVRRKRPENNSWSNRRPENNSWSNRQTDRSRQKYRPDESERRYRKRNRSGSSSYGSPKRRMEETDQGYHCRRTPDRNWDGGHLRDRHQLSDVSGVGYHGHIDDRTSQISRPFDSRTYSFEDGEIEEFQGSHSYDLESDYSHRRPLRRTNRDIRRSRSHTPGRASFEDRKMNALPDFPVYDRNNNNGTNPARSFIKSEVQGRQQRECSPMYRTYGNENMMNPKDEFGPEGHRRGFISDENGRGRRDVRDRLSSQRIHGTEPNIYGQLSRNEDIFSQQRQNVDRRQSNWKNTPGRAFRDTQNYFNNGENRIFQDLMKTPFSPCYGGADSPSWKPFQIDASQRNLCTKYQDVDKYCEEVDRRMIRDGNIPTYQPENNRPPMQHISTYIDKSRSLEQQLQDPELKQEITAEIMGCVIQKTICENKGIPINVLFAHVINFARNPFESPKRMREFLLQNTSCFKLIPTPGPELVTARTDITICQQYARKGTTGIASCGETCQGLHICKFYLFDTCSKPICERGHDLFSTHNIQVLRDHCLDRTTSGNIKLLMSKPDNRNMSTLPVICKFYNNEGKCNKNEQCPRLHVCKFYVDGKCKFEGRCKRDHFFNSPQTKPILQKYGISPSLQREEYRLLLKKTIQSPPCSTTRMATRYFQNTLTKRSTTELNNVKGSIHKLDHEKKILKPTATQTKNNLDSETICNSTAVTMVGSNNKSVSDSENKVGSENFDNPFALSKNAREVSNTCHLQNDIKSASLKTRFTDVNPSDVCIKQEIQKDGDSVDSCFPGAMPYTHGTIPCDNLANDAIVKQEENLDGTEMSDSCIDKQATFPDVTGKHANLLSSPQDLDAITNHQLENSDNLKSGINTTDSEKETQPFEMVGSDTSVAASPNECSNDKHITHETFHCDDKVHGVTVTCERNENNTGNINSNDVTDSMPNDLKEIQILYARTDANESPKHTKLLYPMEMNESKVETRGLNKITPTEEEMEEQPYSSNNSNTAPTGCKSECSSIKPSRECTSSDIEHDVITTHEIRERLDHHHNSNGNIDTISNELRSNNVRHVSGETKEIKQIQPSVQIENETNGSDKLSLSTSTIQVNIESESWKQMNKPDDTVPDSQSGSPETMRTPPDEVTCISKGNDGDVKRENQETHENIDISDDIQESVLDDKNKQRLLHAREDANIRQNEDIDTDTNDVRSTDTEVEAQTVSIESMSAIKSTEKQFNDDIDEENVLKPEKVKETFVSSPLAELNTSPTQVNRIQFTYRGTNLSFVRLFDGRWRLEPEIDQTSIVDNAVNESIQQAYGMLIGVAERLHSSDRESEMEITSRYT